MQAIKIKLSILVGVSMLLLMPSVANAQENTIPDSQNNSFLQGFECDILCWF
ncbi:MAG: hypothetical protein AAFV71_15030 [Cyanobacteria bacterium J06633_8]